MTFQVPGDEAYDPCATYIKLRDAYNAVVMGESVKRVRYHNGEEQRETEFNQGNIAALKEAMNKALAECQAKNGHTQGRRSAIAIGHVRPRYPRIY